MDRNCLSHWFPKLQAAGLPVPKTEIVRTDVELEWLLDGKLPEGWAPFLAKLTDAVQKIGTPCFLRTGLTSGKHDWQDTCHVLDIDRLGRHVGALVEYSAMDLLGLDTSVWCVRELLPTRPIFRVYKGFPVVREWRCFVDVDSPDSIVVCTHPYWPKEALLRGFPKRSSSWEEEPQIQIPQNFEEIYAHLCKPTERELVEVRVLAEKAAWALGGQWSVDILQTDKGWYVTDCALAERSFHWEHCPNKGRFK